VIVRREHIDERAPSWIRALVCRDEHARFFAVLKTLNLLDSNVYTSGVIWQSPWMFAPRSADGPSVRYRFVVVRC